MSRERTGRVLLRMGKYALQYWPLFLLAILGSTPIVRDTFRKIEDTKLAQILELPMMAGLLLVCTAYLVDGSFSPFLYFRF